MDEEVITYRCKGLAFVGQCLGAVSFLAIAVGVAIDGQLFGSLLLGALGCFFAYWASQQCSSVELHQRGKLVIHYRLRPHVAVHTEDIKSITFDDEDNAWTVTLIRRSFEVRGNASGAALIHAIKKHTGV
jgi:hypothetical protein